MPSSGRQLGQAPGAIVDSHVHVWSLNGQYPWQPTFGFIPTEPALPDVLLAEMERTGVAVAMLVQPSAYGPDHRFLLDTVARHPDRLVPVGLVDPADPKMVGTAGSLVGESGCVGLRVNLSLDVPYAITQVNAADRWAELEALGIPITLRAAPMHHELAVQLLSRHPNLRLVVDHLGIPDAGEVESATARLSELAQFPNCWLKLAGLARLSGTEPPYRDLWPIVQGALEAFGAARMMWGSDFPVGTSHGAYAAAIDAIGAMPFVSDDELHRLLVGTSCELWALRPHTVTTERN